MYTYTYIYIIIYDIYDLYIYVVNNTESLVSLYHFLPMNSADHPKRGVTHDSEARLPISWTSKRRRNIVVNVVRVILAWIRSW